MSEENKTEEVKEAEETQEPVVETESAPRTEAVEKVEKEPESKLENLNTETPADRVAEAEYEEAVKDPQDRKEKIEHIKGLFHRSGEKKFSREEVILSKIREEDMLEYLTLEQRRLECLQKARQSRNEKLIKVFQLVAILASIVAVVALLKDNPVVLVNILYILGIVVAIWIWKNPGKK